MALEKASPLAELFSVKMKLTIDILNNWFSIRIKSKFLALSDIERKHFIEKNPLTPETVCCICGLLVDVNTSGEKKWSDFVVEREHLFLKNIYSINELKVMKIDTT